MASRSSILSALGTENNRSGEYGRMGSMFSEWAGFLEKETTKKRVKKLGEALVEEYVKTGGNLTSESLRKIQEDNKATVVEMQYVTESMGKTIQNLRGTRPELFPRTRLDDAGSTIQEHVSREELETPVTIKRPSGEENFMNKLWGAMGQGGMPQRAIAQPQPQRQLHGVPNVPLPSNQQLPNAISGLPPGAAPSSAGGLLSGMGLNPLQQAIAKKKLGFKDPEHEIFYGKGGPVRIEKGQVPPEGSFKSQAARQISKRADEKVLRDTGITKRKNMVDNYKTIIGSLFGQDSKIAIYMSALDDKDAPGKYDKLIKIANDQSNPQKARYAAKAIELLEKITGVSPPVSPPTEFTTPDQVKNSSLPREQKLQILREQFGYE